MRNQTTSGRWRRLARALRDDRGSETIQTLMWALFWLGAVVAAVLLIGPWINGKVSQIIGF